MRKLLIIPLLILFTGCGLFRKTTVDETKNYTKDKTEVVKKSDSSAVKTDKTIIVEKESADTVLHTKGTKISTEKKVDQSDLINGLNIVDSGLVKVHLQYDTLSKSLIANVTVLPEAIPFKFNREKTTFTNTTENTKKSNEVKDKHEAIVEDKAKKTVKEPASMGIWFAIAAFAILVVGGIIWWFLRKPKAIKDSL